MRANGIPTKTSSTPTEMSTAPRKPRRRSRYARYGVVAIGLLSTVGLLGLIKGAQISTVLAAGKAMAKAGPPPETVNTMAAEEQRWEHTLDSVGSVAAARGVTVSNDAPGIVYRIQFQSGEEVQQGQILVELDTRVERGQLAQATARRTLAETTANRTRSLVESGSIAKAQLDNDQAQLDAATAEVTSLKAEVERKVVHAPFAGKVGIRLVNLGQYLAAGTPITALESSEATYVDFSLPQQYLAAVAEGLPVRLALDPGQGDAGTATAPIEGKLIAIGPQIDSTTRTISLRASVPKEADWLRPGMFLRASVILPDQEAVVAISETAVVHAPFGDSVFVVEDEKDAAGSVVRGPDGKASKVARQQFVRVGARRGDFVAMTEGVKAGDEVVVGGAFKLRNGSRIAVTSAAAPRPETSPHPQNR